MKRERRTLSVPSISFQDMDPGQYLGTPPPLQGSSAWPPQSSNSLSLGKQTYSRSRSASTSSLSTPTAGPGSAAMQKKKIVTACQRCRTRKIRCDGALPACKSCVKAGVECMEVDRSGDSNMPRSHVLELENRIKWLEEIIGTRCPEINLAAGPPVDLRSRPSPPAIRIVTTGPDFHVPPSSISSSSSPVFAHSPSSTCATPASFDFSPGMSPGYLAPLSPFTLSDVSPAPSPAPSSPLLQPQDPLAHEVGLLSLAAFEEPKYIGSSSGVSFARLVFADASDADFRIESRDVKPGRPWPGTTSEPAVLPNSDECVLFSSTFFDTVHVQYPFLHRPTFENCLEATYMAVKGAQYTLPQGYTLAIARFQVFLVLSIGANIFSSRVGHSLDSEGYFASAMQSIDHIPLTGSFQAAQNALLLAMQSLHASGGLNVWYLNSIIMASCIDLGLHRRLLSLQGPVQSAIRRRVFWCAYCLDRSIGIASGRPFVLRDESFDVEFPDEADNDEELSNTLMGSNLSPSASTARTTFSGSIYLFRIIKVLSNIKSTLYRVSQPTGRWPKKDLPEWQMMTYRDLSELRDQARASMGGVRRGSSSGGGHLGSGMILELKYHEAIQLLFRPITIFQRPTAYALQQCYSSATETIRIYTKLKRFGELPYTWLTTHSIFLSGITMLYTYRNCREVNSQKSYEAPLSEDIRSCSSLLADLATRWPNAQKSRSRFDSLAQSTLAHVSAGFSSNSRMLSPNDTPRRTSSSSSASHQQRGIFTEMQSQSLEVPNVAPSSSSSSSTSPAAHHKNKMTNNNGSNNNNNNWYHSVGAEPQAVVANIDMSFFESAVNWDLSLGPASGGNDPMLTTMEGLNADGVDPVLAAMLSTADGGGDTTMWGMEHHHQGGGT